MELRFSDFESKKEISAVKLSFENEPAFEVARNYKIAIPASSIAAPYITYGNKSDLRANTFMQRIGQINIRGCTTDIFEQDMLDFKHEELRSVGTVVFNQEKFGWKLKDLNTGEEYNLDEITAIKHLGSLYDHKSFAGCSIEIIYKLLGKDMPKEIQYAALD